MLPPLQHLMFQGFNNVHTKKQEYQMMLHCFHAYRNGRKRVVVHATATDTDVLVLAIITAICMEIFSRFNCYKVNSFTKFAFTFIYVLRL
jgi:hypothetical protein